MNRGNNTVAFGHVALTQWGDRRHALGRGGSTVLGRMIEAAGMQPGGTHGDPTMSMQIRDEAVYATERAVNALACEDEDGARALLAYYVLGLQPGQIAMTLGFERKRTETMIECAQSWVGARLMEWYPEVEFGATGTD